MYGDDKSMYERAKLMGIDKICVSGFLAVWTDYEEGNKIVWNAMKRYPGFYHGYAALQPQYVKNWKRDCGKHHPSVLLNGDRSSNGSRAHQ